MITARDEHPTHPGSERNSYDRFFFNGYSRDADAFFAVAFGFYPGRQVADAALSVIVDGVQHNVRASRRLRAPDDRETTVGPVTVSILEPLRRLRVDVDDRDGSGISGHADFSARGPVFEEPPYRWEHDGRTIFDIVRFTQNGTWSGTWSVPGAGTVTLDPARWWGTRDRSWGIRPVGEREPGSGAMPLGFYWLWAPLNFDDGGGLFDVNEHPDGTRWHENAMWAAAEVGAAVEQGTAGYTMRLRSGTRHAETATLDLELPSGSRRVVLTPQFNFYMHGIGYTHPTWGHGMRVGDDVRTYDSLVTAEADEQAPMHLHIQAVCRAERDDGAVGQGVLEQLVIGPSATLGLTGLLDAAP